MRIQKTASPKPQNPGSTVEYNNLKFKIKNNLE
jgi:hypothetical protein